MLLLLLFKPLSSYVPSILEGVAVLKIILTLKIFVYPRVNTRPFHCVNRCHVLFDVNCLCIIIPSFPPVSGLVIQLSSPRLLS